MLFTKYFSQLLVILKFFKLYLSFSSENKFNTESNFNKLIVLNEGPVLK